ncbi:TRAP transporter large permease subunit [Chloroflexota bacterium]
MDWGVPLACLAGGFLVLLLIGVPVAFAFTLVNIVGVFVLWGGEVGLRQLTLSIFTSVALWALVPIPMFMLMGEVLFRTGLAQKAISAIDEWLGRLPGRLSLLAVGGGTLFATCSGSTMAGVALLGSLLVPEMEQRGYQKSMSLGPIMASGGLAMMIPPSIIAVLLASYAEISVARTLIGGIVPGILMALFYASYIIVRTWLNPSLAPPYAKALPPLSTRILSFVRHILPLGFIIFAVVGTIFAGIASPTEASALGALCSLVLCAAHRMLNWKVLKESVVQTFYLAVMVLMIFTGAVAFSQVLTFSGISDGLAGIIGGFAAPPILIVAIMMAILVLLGCLMDSMSALMITTPIFFPLIPLLGFNEIWFAVLMLINLEIGQRTPPFGFSLFVMKGVAPPDTTMRHIILSILPFLVCDFIVMTLIMVLPRLALWLPELMLS